MGSRVLVWAACGLLLAAVAFSFLRHPDIEPEYPGRALACHTLAQWLEIATMGGSAKYSTQWSEEAVRAIGTNALPTLLTWIRYQPSPVARMCHAILSPVPLPKNIRGALWRPMALEGSLEFLADTGFRILNTNAAPAIPQLARLAAESNRVVATRAVIALGRIGPQALPQLLAIINNPNARARGQAVQVLARFGTNVPTVTPLILRFAGDPAADVSYPAILMFGALGVSPEAAVPVLTKALSSTYPMTRSAAAESLAEFGCGAIQAVPRLRASLLDTNWRVRYWATNALQKISPDIFTNTPAP